MEHTPFPSSRLVNNFSWFRIEYSVLPISCSGINFAMLTIFFQLSCGAWCCFFWLGDDHFHRCHIHITDQDRPVTRSSHVRTHSATHCTKTWVQPSTAQNHFNATTHSHMQMDRPLVRSWLTSSLYPWSSPPMTILTSRSGMPMQCNISWSLHNDYIFKASYFLFAALRSCGYDQGVNAGKVTTVDGILGLGPSSVSLVSQLKNHKIITKNVIGHYLSTKGGGFLFFGEESVPSSDVTWVPMAPRTPGYVSSSA